MAGSRSAEQTVDGLADALPIDLARPGDDPWSQLAVPDGWREVARLAREVAGDLEALADHVVSCIEVEMPGYVHDAVPIEDLRASVIRNIEMILVGVAEHRRPTEAELAIRRELGVRRAVQGLPVDAITAAYHVGHRELWQALVRRLPDDGGRAAAQLLEAATTVWGWVTDVTEAIAAAHARTARRLEARVVGARQRFVELLVGGDLDGAEADLLARTLGFASDEPFRVAVVRGGADDRDAVDLQRSVDELDGRHVVVVRGALLVIVWQGTGPDELIAAARAVVDPGASVAVGARRHGLRGARDSLVDAELTLEVTADGAGATFDDAWLWATLASSEARLASVLADGVAVASAHPHLAEAVHAFGAHAFSVADAARHLQVHANTVAYRLDRWAGLTGWDPRTFPGLVRSLAALHAVHGGRLEPSIADAGTVHLPGADEVDGGDVGSDEAATAPGDA